MRVPVQHEFGSLHGSSTLGFVVLWNVMFSVAWFVTAWWLYREKRITLHMNDNDAGWYGNLLALWTVLEPLRLRLGWQGNRQQSVARLFGFIFVTLTTQVTIMLIIIFLIPKKSSLDRGLCVVQLLFAGVELITTYRALGKLIRKSTVEFYIRLGLVTE